jgi:hypothetical protein
MGKVNVQSGRANLTGTSLDITLDEVVQENTWVRLTTRIGANADAHDVTGRIIDSTTLRLQRESDAGTNDVAWFVVEDSEATVQRGEFAFPSGSNDETISISTVDLSKSFIAITVRSEGGNMNIGYVTAVFDDDSTIRLRRQATGHIVHVSWEVVTISDATVQSGYTELSGTSVDESITAVDLAHSFILAHRSADAQNLHRSHARSRFGSSSQVAIDRGNADGSMFIGWFVVECDRYTVQRADSGNTTITPVNIPIDPVDLTQSWLTSSSRNGGGATSNANARYNVYFDGNDTVVRQKQSASQTTWVETFVIEMEPAISSGTTVNESISSSSTPDYSLENSVEANTSLSSSSNAESSINGGVAVDGSVSSSVTPESTLSEGIEVSESVTSTTTPESSLAPNVSVFGTIESALSSDSSMEASVIVVGTLSSSVTPESFLLAGGFVYNETLSSDVTPASSILNNVEVDSVIVTSSTPQSEIAGGISVEDSLSSAISPTSSLSATVTFSESLSSVITSQTNLGNSLTVVTTLETALTLESSLTSQADVNVVIVSEVSPDSQIEAVVITEAVYIKYLTTMVDTSPRATLQDMSRNAQLIDLSASCIIQDTSNTATMVSTKHQATMI